MLNSPKRVSFLFILALGMLRLTTSWRPNCKHAFRSCLHMSTELKRGPRSIVGDRVKAAIALSFGSEFDKQDPMVVPSGKPEYGDYQCNAAMILSKKLGLKPLDIANKIMENLVVDNVLSKESLSIAGPGFINMKLDHIYIKRKLIEMYRDPSRLSIAPYDKPTRIIVDFSSPNIAKEMHVGHLRSTIIGDSLSKILEFLGHDILRINHVGDWGTQFGMLIRFLKENHADYYKACIESDDDEAAMATVPIKDLVDFYKSAKKRFDSDKEFEEASRGEVVRLQAGDAQSLRAWKAICQVSRVEFNKIYELLRINVLERGESFYNPLLSGIVDRLEEKKIAVISEGATCIFLPGYDFHVNYFIIWIIFISYSYRF
jgi:arginyl-tRNA synthetase